jgi:hypothetical protein
MARLGQADDATWYISTLAQGQAYSVVGGAPDEYVIQSWVGAPFACGAETAHGVYRSVLDFCEKFVRAKP